MDIFTKNLSLLKKLFYEEVDEDRIEFLREVFIKTEDAWYKNVRRFSSKVIQYLLICEAPPDTGDYFYINFKKPLFNTVWNTFFPNEKALNSEDAYTKLAEKGFLLIDTLPYSINYSSKRSIRKSDEYGDLIWECKDWWLEKLNSNFTFANSSELKVAFGFKLNSEKLIIALNNKLLLKSVHNSKLGYEEYRVNDSNLVADKKTKWQPSISELKRVFEINEEKGKIG